MQDETLKTAQVLIVDDQEPHVHHLEGLLRRAGYSNLASTTDRHQVLSLCADVQPDLIILDLAAVESEGLQMLELLKPMIPDDTYTPVVMLTEDLTLLAKQQALAGGAKDFLTKPFDPAELLARIQNLLEGRFLLLELQNQNQFLEKRIRERSGEVEEAHIELLERLALAAEFRDDDTGEHTKRVGQTSALLARAWGLPQDQVMLIRRAAPLHDVGKVGIPDRILLKPGRLTPEEFEVMKTHTTIGAKILSGGRFPLLKMAEEIALTHHEQWDGSGYPRGLKGEAIPLAGRFVAIADAFDALTHARTYRKAWSAEEAVAELKRCAGKQFDPKAVDAFLALHADPLATSVLRLPVGSNRLAGE